MPFARSMEQWRRCQFLLWTDEGSQCTRSRSQDWDSLGYFCPQHDAIVRKDEASVWATALIVSAQVRDAACRDTRDLQEPPTLELVRAIEQRLARLIKDHPTVANSSAREFEVLEGHTRLIRLDEES